MQAHFQKSKPATCTVLPVSATATSLFAHSLPKILALVNEKFTIETTYLKHTISSDQICLVKDTQRSFGELLLALYEFHLYENLLDEFFWYISVLTSRGFERNYFEQMIRTWTIAIHSVVKPPESHELVRPLQWLTGHLSLLYEQRALAEEGHAQELAPFLELLLKKKRKEAAEYVLSRSTQGVSLEKLYAELLTLSLREIGRLWQKNSISVVDVHVATDICRYIMMRLADSVTPEAALPYTALVTCVPGEEHETASEIVENYLETKGWQILSMGHIAPEADIIRALEAHTPDVVFLSVTLCINLPSAKALTLKIRHAAPQVKIVIGGRAAVCAREVLMHCADAIVESIGETHIHALTLVSSHA
jgi:methanogenic corrinoid protein MtbC1